MNPKAIAKRLQSFSRHSVHDTFRDFVAMAAIAISNQVDLDRRDDREKEYLRIVGKYQKDEVDEFCKALGDVALAFETALFDDVLGKVFGLLEVFNSAVGQFMTPYELSLMMATQTLGDADEVNAKIADGGFITVCDPAVGCGGMLIAVAEAMNRMNINYQQHLHVTATDVDLRAVHTAYIQLSLLHIPAVIIHGNTLSGEVYDRWYTPAHILGLWRYRLRRKETKESAEAAT